MPRTREQDWDGPLPAAGIAGPLFDGGGPFANSTEKPTSEEVLLGEMLWRHQGRAYAIQVGEIAAVTGIEYRYVKSTVEQLRKKHHCRIGSNQSVGYFWIVDDEDRKLATGAFHSQILAMWETLGVIDERAELHELLRRMREKL
jgi:hypothetical protein